MLDKSENNIWKNLFVGKKHVNFIYIKSKVLLAWNRTTTQ